MNKITSLQFLYKHPIWNILFDYQDIKNFYVCGGYIRDYILYGNGGKDIDVFINCTIEELNILITYLEKYGRVVYGQYGSPRFYPNAIDGHYVDIVPFYNFIVSPKPILTIDDLLKNFDFTANAICRCPRCVEHSFRRTKPADRPPVRRSVSPSCGLRYNNGYSLYHKADGSCSQSQR